MMALPPNAGIESSTQRDHDDEDANRRMFRLIATFRSFKMQGRICLTVAKGKHQINETAAVIVAY
jgi:hypothetical protein